MLFIRTRNVIKICTPSLRGTHYLICMGLKCINLQLDLDYNIKYGSHLSSNLPALHCHSYQYTRQDLKVVRTISLMILVAMQQYTQACLDRHLKCSSVSVLAVDTLDNGVEEDGDDGIIDDDDDGDDDSSPDWVGLLSHLCQTHNVQIQRSILGVQKPQRKEGNTSDNHTYILVDKNSPELNRDVIDEVFMFRGVSEGEKKEILDYHNRLVTCLHVGTSSYLDSFSV